MEFQQPANANSWRAKIQRMGGFLSSMVMPNIGVFIAWGLMAAFFIPTGWTPNEHLNELVPPILNYLLPVLIGYTGGYNVYGKRGGAIGALATMGGSSRCRYHDVDRWHDYGTDRCDFNEENRRAA